jgi:hypothetical protein
MTAAPGPEEAEQPVSNANAASRRPQRETTPLDMFAYASLLAGRSRPRANSSHQLQLSTIGSARAGHERHSPTLDYRTSISQRSKR